MWNNWWFLLLLLCPSFGFSQTLIQASETTDAEYQSALYEQTHAQSYMDWQKSQFLNELQARELRQIYTAAMAAYLNGDMVNAQKNFEKVAELRHQHHWGESARFLIFTACLRRAQLETKSYVKQAWLNASLEIGWDLEPDSKIFPPPFIQEWQQQKQQLQWISVHSLIADPYLKGLMIAGHFYDLKKSVPQIPKIQARISFLSNQKQPITLVTQTEQILKEIHWKEWLVAQKCEEPQKWSAPAIKTSFKVIWPASCMKTADLNITQAPSNFQSSSAPIEKPKVSNKWIWWGLGTLAVAYVLYEQNKKQESTNGGSSTYGF